MDTTPHDAMPCHAIHYDVALSRIELHWNAWHCKGC
jgi:hypothetical protein